MMTTASHSITGTMASSRSLVPAVRTRDFATIVSAMMGPVETHNRTSHLIGAKRLLVEAAVAIALDGGAIPMPATIFANFDLDVITRAAFVTPNIQDETRQRALAYCRRIAITGAAYDEAEADQHLVFSALVESAFTDAA